MYKIYEEINGELSPLSDTSVLKGIKEQFLTGKTYGYIKVKDTDIVLTEQDYIKNFDVSELRFVPDVGIFGQCVAKKLEININNENEIFTLQDKELQVYLKVKYEGSSYYIKYGTFIVQKPETETTTDNTSFTALDYMIKANARYVDDIIYPCTLRQLAQNICAKIGVTLSEETFRNDDFVVVDNQFVSGETYRNVLQGIAMSAFSWARIDEDNVLHFDLKKKNTIDEEIDYDGYFNLNKQDLVYGPINRIIIRESGIEGENVTIEDLDSIEQYGATELVIADNPFAYTQLKRQQLIEAATDLFGFTYMPMNEISLTGYGYLDCTSKIKFKTLKNEYLETYLFNHIISYNGAVLDKMEAPALTKTETLYAYKPELSEAIKRTEIIVDKQNQTIEAVVENVGTYNSRISRVEQGLEQISQTVSNVVEYKRTIEGTTQIHITDAMEQDALQVQIKGSKTYLSELYPRNRFISSEMVYILICQEAN